VGTSEAALLAKLSIKPFEYGLVVKYIYEGGVFSPEVMKIKDSDLMAMWSSAVGNVAALSIATGYLTEAAIAPIIADGFKNVMALALEADYIEFEQVKKAKDFLDNPDAFVAAVVEVAPAAGGGGGGGGGGGAAAAPAPEPEPEEEEEEMGFDLFD